MLGQFDLNFERKLKRSLLVKLMVVSKVVICKILLHDGLFFLKFKSGEKYCKMAKHDCEHRKIFKVYLAIFQHYTCIMMKHF